MKEPLQPIAQFDVRPLRRVKRWRHLKWRVLVFASGVGVAKVYGRARTPPRAFVRCWLDGKKDKRGYLGYMVFPKNFGCGVMSHEATHAAVRTLSYMTSGLSWSKDVHKVNWTEERLCLLVGNLSREITVACLSKGVWK